MSDKFLKRPEGIGWPYPTYLGDLSDVAAGDRRDGDLIWWHPEVMPLDNNDQLGAGFLMRAEVPSDDIVYWTYGGLSNSGTVGRRDSYRFLMDSDGVFTLTKWLPDTSGSAGDNRWGFRFGITGTGSMKLSWAYLGDTPSPAGGFTNGSSSSGPDRWYSPLCTGNGGSHVQIAELTTNGTGYISAVLTGSPTDVWAEMWPEYVKVDYSP